MEGLGLENVVHKLPLNERNRVVMYMHGDKNLPASEYQRIAMIEKEIANAKSQWWHLGHQDKAYEQFKCQVLILDFMEYKQSVQILLKRKVEDFELIGSGREKIKGEVESAYNAWLEELDKLTCPAQ